MVHKGFGKREFHPTPVQRFRFQIRFHFRDFGGSDGVPYSVYPEGTYDRTNVLTVFNLHHVRDYVESFFGGVDEGIEFVQVVTNPHIANFACYDVRRHDDFVGTVAVCRFS